MIVTHTLRGEARNVLDGEDVEHVVDKLDVDHDSSVELELKHVVRLACEEGLGIVVENKQTDARNLLGGIKESKPRKEDIVQE